MKYLVRTLMPIDAADPVAAVEKYVTLLQRSSPNELVYRAEDEESGEMFYVFQGKSYDLDSLTKMLETKMLEASA